MIHAIHDRTLNMSFESQIIEIVSSQQVGCKSWRMTPYCTWVCNLQENVLDSDTWRNNEAHSLSVHTGSGRSTQRAASCLPLMKYTTSRNNEGHLLSVNTGWGRSNSLPQTANTRGATAAARNLSTTAASHIPHHGITHLHS